MDCPFCSVPMEKQPAQHGGLEEPSWDAYYECPECQWQPEDTAAEIEDSEKADLNFN